MKIISIKMPSSPFDITNNDDGYSVIFYKNVKELKDIDGMTGNEITMWEYDTYTLPVINSSNLYASIESNLDEWLQKAKDYEFDIESAKIRAYRDKLLNDCDTVYCNAANWELMDKDARLAWQDYKQALRGLTQQAGFPYTISWPKKPLLDVDRSKPTEVEVLRAENDILGQTAAQLQLDNMQLNSAVDTLGATVAQLQLENIAAKGGAS